MTDPIIQYIVIRSDLKKVLKWPAGAIIAQACHASCAAMHLFYDDPNTKAYLKDLDNMHKAVLEVADEESLRKLETELKQEQIDHKMWIEQPENIPTCIAIKPYLKSQIRKYVCNFKLLKE